MSFRPEKQITSKILHLQSQRRIYLDHSLPLTSRQKITVQSLESRKRPHRHTSLPHFIQATTAPRSQIQTLIVEERTPRKTDLLILPSSRIEPTKPQIAHSLPALSIFDLQPTPIPPYLSPTPISIKKTNRPDDCSRSSLPSHPPPKKREKRLTNPLPQAESTNSLPTQPTSRFESLLETNLSPQAESTNYPNTRKEHKYAARLML